MLYFKKSSDPDFLKSTIEIHKLDLLLKEQLEQRKDLSVITVLLKQMLHDTGLQKQVDDYFEDTEHIPEEKHGSSQGNI